MAVVNASWCSSILLLPSACAAAATFSTRRRRERLLNHHRYHNHYHYLHNNNNNRTPIIFLSSCCATSVPILGSSSSSEELLLEVREIRDSCNKWQWKGHTINYFVAATAVQGQATLSSSPSSNSLSLPPPLLLVHGFGASIPHWRR